MTTKNRESEELSELLLRVAGVVGGTELRREVATVLSVEGIDGSVTAVVGYVKRGKSTLVNQVLGRALSPTGPLPETASAIAYRRAPRRKAIGVTTDLGTRRVPASEPAFRKACSRAAAKDLVLVQFQGEVDLEEGVTLVDTAGAGESSDSNRSLAVGGTAEALMKVADAAVVVVGCPPGPEGAELDHIRRVVSGVGTGRVRLVIKALDSSIDRLQLEEWREYLAEIPDLSELAAEAYLVSDGDLKDVERLKQWLKEQSPRLVRRQLAPQMAQRLILRAAAHLDESIELDLTDEELTRLEPSLADALRPRTTVERLRVAQAALDAEYELARRKYEDSYRSWMAEYTPLRDAHTAKREEIRRYQMEGAEQAKSRSAGNAGTGCLGLVLVPLSFVAFPVGPVLAIGVLVANIWSRNVNYESASQKIDNRIAAVEPELSRLHRQLELLDARKPVLPSPPPRLGDKVGKSPKGGGRRLAVLAAALLLVLMAGGAFAIIRSQRSTEAVVPPSTQPSTRSTSPSTTRPNVVVTAPVNLEGLVTATVDSQAPPHVVRAVQDLLRATCCSNVVVDGVWGPQTEAAVDTLREQLALMPGAGVDEAVWRRLLDRPFRGVLGADTRATAVPGVVVPAGMVLNSDSWVEGVGRAQHFVFPYAAAGRLDRWIVAGGAGAPEGEWFRCRSTPPVGADAFEWVGGDGVLIQLVPGDPDLGREEVHLLIRDQPGELTGSCAPGQETGSSSTDPTETTMVLESTTTAATTTTTASTTTTSSVESPAPTTSAVDSDPSDQQGASLALDSYLDGLAMWSTEGTRQMIQRSLAGSPARAYAEHLAQGFRAGVSGTPSVEISAVGDGAKRLCIGSSCFQLSGFDIRDDRVVSFLVDGLALSELVAFWQSADAPADCWFEGNSACPGPRAVVVQLRSLFVSGSTLFISLDASVGGGVEGLGAFPTYIVVTPRVGAPIEVSLPVGSDELRPGTDLTWIATVRGLGIGDAELVTVGIRWDGSVYDWEIELPVSSRS